MIIETLIIVLTALISVAFFTLAERRIIAVNHNRKGPNKSSVKGITQPLADALKLLTKEWKKVKTSNKIVFILRPAIGLASYMIIWRTLPRASSTTKITLAVLFLVAVLSTTIIFSISTGWSSNRKYAILGRYRATAQAISYEISMAVFILAAILIVNGLNTAKIKEVGTSRKLLLIPILAAWIMTVLAETRRTPFDFTERESELVSGFNTEFYGSLFSIFFIAEYMALIFITALTGLLFLQGNSMAVYTETVVVLTSITVIRMTLPRSRYDKLISMAWLTVIPISVIALVLISITSNQRKSWKLE